MAGPRTSYGGRLGSVWIRKKKRRSCDGFHDDQPAAAAADSGVAVVSSLLVKTGACDVQTETTVDVATSGSDTELTKTASSSSSSSDDNADNDVFSTDGSDSSPDAATVTAPTTAPTSSRSTSRRRLIGWDEDLCRPIYEYESVNNPSSASACSSDDDEENKSDGDDLDKEKDDDASASTEDLSMALSLESSQESLNSSVGENTTGTTNTSSTTRPDSSRSSNRTRSRAARSYGGRSEVEPVSRQLLRQYCSMESMPKSLTMANKFPIVPPRGPRGRPPVLAVRERSLVGGTMHPGLESLLLRRLHPHP